MLSVPAGAAGQHWIKLAREEGTHSQVSGDVGSGQDPGGRREEDGKDREERFFSKVRTHVFPHERT